MKVNRFVTEYATYVKRLYMAADMPATQKEHYTRDIDAIVNRLKHGYLTVNDTMFTLAKAEKFVLEYIRGTENK